METCKDGQAHMQATSWVVPRDCLRVRVYVAENTNMFMACCRYRTEWAERVYKQHMCKWIYTSSLIQQRYFLAANERIYPSPTTLLTFVYRILDMNAVGLCWYWARSFDMIKQMRFCLHSTHSKHRMKLFPKHRNTFGLIDFIEISELSVDCIKFEIYARLGK